MTPSELTARAAELTTQKYARLVKLTGEVQLGDAMMIRHFPCSDMNTLAAMKTALDAVSSYTNPTTQNNEPWTGKWFVVSNEIGDHKRYGVEQGVVQTLKLGYWTTLGWDANAKTWTDARLKKCVSTPTTARAAISSTSSPQTIANTTSDGAVAPPDMPTDGVQFTTQAATAHMLFIEFPNLDPTKAKACADSIALTYNAVVLNGETYGSATYPLHKLSVTWGEAEDGSGYVSLVLASPQFTAVSFSGQGTTNATRTYTCHDVPVAVGQAIVDTWKDGTTNGRDGSIGGYSNTGGTCTVTLSERIGLNENYDTSWIQTDLRTWQRKHFAWGMTKAQIGAWADSHNIAIADAPDAPGAPGTNDCQVRDVQIGLPRGDGYYDGTITETRYGPLASTTDFLANIAAVSIETFTGTKLSTKTVYGYRLRKSEITAPAVATYFGTTIKGVGKSATCKISNETNWVFDFVAEITEQSAAVSNDVDTGSNGIRVESFDYKGVNLADGAAKATLESDLASSPLRRVEVDVDMQGNELANVKAKATTVRETEPTEVKPASGTGIVDELIVGKNTTIAKVNAAITAPTRLVRVQPDANMDDAGAVESAKIRKTTLRETPAVTLQGGGTGVVDALVIAKNVEPTNTAIPIPASSRLVRVTVDADVDDAGNGAAKIRKQTVQETSAVVSGSTVDGDVTIGAFKNVAALPALPNDPRTTVELSGQADDAGAITAQMNSVRVPETVVTVTPDGASTGVKETMRVGQMQDSGVALPATSHSIDQEAQIEVTGSGKIRKLVVRNRQLVESNDTFNGTGTGIKHSVQPIRNKKASDVSIPVSTPRKRVTPNLTRDDKGAVNGEIDIVETQRTEIVLPEVDTIEGKQTVQEGTNADSVPAISGNKRTTIRREAKADDAGAINYRQEKIEGVATTAVMDGTGSGIGEKVTVTRLADAAPSPAGATRTRDVSVDLEATNGGAINAKVTERTVVETTLKTAAGSGTGIVPSVSVARNVDPSAPGTIPASSPRIKVDADFDVNDRGGGTLKVKAQTEPLTSKDSIITGTKHNQRTIAVAGNAEASEIPATPAPGIGQERTADVDPGRDGTLRYKIATETKTPFRMIEQLVGGTAGEKVFMEIAKQQTDLPPATDPAVGETIDTQPDIEGDELKQWRRMRKVSEELQGALVSAGINGAEIESIKPMRNQRTLPAPSTSEFVSGFLINDTKTYDYILHKLSLAEGGLKLSDSEAGAEVQRSNPTFRAKIRSRTSDFGGGGLPHPMGYYECGETHFTLPVEWYRTFTRTVNVTYSLTRPAATSQAGDRLTRRREHIEQIGRIWVTISETLTYGEWTMNTAVGQAKFLCHISEEGQIQV